MSQLRITVVHTLTGAKKDLLSVLRRLRDDYRRDQDQIYLAAHATQGIEHRRMMPYPQLEVDEEE